MVGLWGRFEFRGELGLEAAGGLVELCFSPRHVSQHGVHLLGAQDQESEQKHEQ